LAKVRIGHFAEAEVFASAGKWISSTRAKCSRPPTKRITSGSTITAYRWFAARANLGEALRRIAEGAAMIRTKGEAGSGNVVEAVAAHARDRQPD